MDFESATADAESLSLSRDSGVRLYALRVGSVGSRVGIA